LVKLKHVDMNYRIGFEDGREGIHWLKEIKPISKIQFINDRFGKIENRRRHENRCF
jgi:hypothetical protein